MKGVIGSVVWLFLSVFLIGAVNAGSNGAAAIEGKGVQRQNPEQGVQSEQPAPNKVKLSKRNKTKLKQAEAAKKRQDLIEKSRTDSIK